MNTNQENDLTLDLSTIMNLRTFNGVTQKLNSTYGRICDLLVNKYDAKIDILRDDELFHRIESALTYEIQEFLQEQHEE